MQLSEFHTEVRRVARRGNALDDEIPGAVRRAARWIERNYTLKYMERYVEFTVDLGADHPEALEFPYGTPIHPERVKSFNFFRWRREHSYLYLTQMDARDWTPKEEGVPTHYWLAGRDTIWLNRIPTEALIGEISFNEFSEWPTSGTATHWLLGNAEDALLAASMLELVPVMRDQRLEQHYAGKLPVLLRALIAADQDLRQTNRSEQMQYIARS